LLHDFDAGNLAILGSLGAVHRGYSLAELAVVLAVMGLVAALALPRWGTLLDRIAVERAASEVTTALAVTRNAAVLRATRARLTIGADSLGIDEWGDRRWLPVLRWPGPQSHAVSLEASNETVIFGATGIGWGVSNTTVVLRRGTQTAKITMSRVGRVKRW
jgi:prepilin-type N-terminal cleavage/methylation domain-containing protein